MSHLEAVCVPTQPYEIRVAVARELAQFWSVIISSPNGKEVVPTCCQLVLNLLQDSDVDVRTHMAISVAKILPGIMIVLYHISGAYEPPVGQLISSCVCYIAGNFHLVSFCPMLMITQRLWLHG